MRFISKRILSEHQAIGVVELVYKIEKLLEMVGNCRYLGADPLQVSFVHFAHGFHALIDGVEIAISATFRLGIRLNQNDAVTHVEILRKIDLAFIFT